MEETMTIIIDIKKKNYKSVMLTQNRPIGQRLPYGLSDTFKNGTILPDNLTNGDMIRAIFPDASFEKYATNNNLKPVLIIMNGITEFDLDWWDAPYERGQDNE